jgi:hypothetical protein
MIWSRCLGECSLADLREASEALRTWTGIKLMNRYESGARVAQATLYHDQVFPYGLFGPVEVIWRPEEAHLTERTIWLRIHPSIYAEATSLLESLLASPSGQASTSTAPQQSAIRMTDLRDQIDSFEIMGPKSARILRRILRLSKTEGKDKANVSHHVCICQLANVCSSLRV